MLTTVRVETQLPKQVIALKHHPHTCIIISLILLFNFMLFIRLKYCVNFHWEISLSLILSTTFFIVCPASILDNLSGDSLPQWRNLNHKPWPVQFLNLSKQTCLNTFSLFPLYSNNFWVQTKPLKIPYTVIFGELL